MKSGRASGRKSPGKAQEQPNRNWGEVRSWIDQLQHEWAERRSEAEARREKEPYRLPEDSLVE